MLTEERLKRLAFAADHNGLHDAHAVEYFHGVDNGPGQVRVTCFELKVLLGAYLERRIAKSNDDKSVQDSTSATDEVPK